MANEKKKKKGVKEPGVIKDPSTIYKPTNDEATEEMIESFQNDRSPIFDRRMYDQPEPYGNPKEMKTGGMSSCPYRPDGVRGGGKAIAGMKFKGVR